jgi:hypothetical protein
MAKRDVQNIIAKGSAKQRALLLVNDVALTSIGKEKLLSQSEFNALLSSFKTPADIKIYNRFKQCDKVVKDILNLLNQKRLICREDLVRIEGFLILKYTLESFEEAVNSSLFTIEDKKIRNNFIDELVNNSHYIYVESTKKQNKYGDYYNIDISKPRNENYPLLELIIIYKNRVINLFGDIKAIVKLFNDYLEKNSFNIKAYKDLVSDIEVDLNRDSLFDSEKVFFPDYKSIEVNEDIYTKLMLELVEGRL